MSCIPTCSAAFAANGASTSADVAVRAWRRVTSVFMSVSCAPPHCISLDELPGRREAAELLAGGKHAVARNDDRHRIASHRLADVARAFPLREAERARERAIGRGRAPWEPAHCLVELAAERVEAPEVNRNRGE